MKKTLLAIAIATTASTVYANDEIHINGFSTITAGKTSDEVGVFGYDDTVDFSKGSLLGLQFSKALADNIQVTTQFIARGEDGYSPEVEWAYLTYKMNHKLSVTAGRLRMPLFRHSDVLDVGYSYHWLEAPQAVYDVPFNNIEGIRVDFSNYVGNFEYSSQFAFGVLSDDLSLADQPAQIEATGVALFNLNMSYNSWKVRFVGARGDISMHFAPADNALSAIKPLAPAIYEAASWKDDKGVFMGIGIEYDNYEWFVGGEVTHVEVADSYFSDDTSYYITAGWRLGKWTPSITIEGKDSDKPLKFVDDISGLPESVSAPLTAVLAGIQTPLMEDYVATNLAVRYDLATGVALKADIIRMNDKMDDCFDNTLFRASLNYVF